MDEITDLRFRIIDYLAGLNCWVPFEMLEKEFRGDNGLDVALRMNIVKGYVERSSKGFAATLAGRKFARLMNPKEE